MVTLETVLELLRARLKRVLDAAALAMPQEQFLRYRRVVLDEFGRRGLLKDLEREQRKRDRHGQG
jgi:hypothetical protein